MLTLSYGFQKPENGDKGSIFFPALAANIQQLNDHTHNGTDSARLTAAALTITTQTVSSASWVATTGGTYRQAVTVPVGFSYDTTTVTFRNASGDMLYLTVERISATQFYVYINDNTLTLTAVYGL